MRGYPFIAELFTNVLSKSKGIEGRFYLCPNMGNEISSDDLNQVIKDLVVPTGGKKTPICLGMPPVAYGEFIGKIDEWVKYHFIHFFLKPSYYSSTNQPLYQNPNTQTSTHTIPQDWHDMFRCATSFIRVLDKVSREKGLIRSTFRLDQSFTRIIKPVSFIGVDRLSGVRLDFRADVFQGCELEDYVESDISSITVPVADSHPEHIM